MKIAVIGAGSWGTAISALISPRSRVALWTRRAELARSINEDRRNPDYLPALEVPTAVRATADLTEAVADAALVLMAVPSHGYRTVLEAAARDVTRDTPIISLTKGIEPDTLLRMTEVAAAVLPDHEPATLGVLTGPNLAEEVAAGQPTAAVLALADEEQARLLQPSLMTPSFRVYTNPDVIGCEAAGALKNVMAIAAGIAHGLGYGDNTLAALITRALAEITRLGVAMGGKPSTFAGLAGIGDLVATCTSDKSRNHRVGVGLGRGQSLASIIDEMRMVAEGVLTTRAVLALGRRHEVDLPIANQVGAVLYEGRDPRDLVPELMTRRARSELDR